MNTLPSFNDSISAKFNVVFSEAHRNQTRGRFSSGLILFCSKRFKLVTINIEKNWIFVKISFNNMSLFVGGLYLSPGTDGKEFFDKLDDILWSIECNNDVKYMLLLSDLNSRIGQSGQLDDDILSGCSISAQRLSMDEVINGRGKLCVNFFDSHGLVVLNGRTVSDTPANYTFVAHSGRSVIDLMAANLDLALFVTDSGIFNCCLTSEHLPYFVGLSFFGVNSTSTEPKIWRSKLIWNPNLSVFYNYLMEHSLREVNFEEGDINGLSQTLADGINCAANSLGMTKAFRSRCRRGRNRWFGRECAVAKSDLRQALMTCRKSGFTTELTSIFMDSRSNYRNTLKLAKSTYLISIKDRIVNSRSPSEFWSAFGEFSGISHAGGSSGLSREDVYTHFSATFNCFGREEIILPIFPTAQDEFLDREIGRHELDLVLGGCKVGKAPGMDDIPYEFYKCLNDNNRNFLLSFFNRIFNGESTPTCWSRLKMFLLFKKGDRSDPRNFRGISLINAIAKLFTSILANRITEWADFNNLMLEGQNGFRRGRGCVDNLYILTSCVGERLRLGGGRLLAFFVDFSQAFDKVRHSRLFEKLYNMGLSRKMLNLLASIYGDASVEIMIDRSESAFVELKNGVLQGDCLSPLLFSLYLSDLENFLRTNGLVGVDLNSLVSINSILFADDVVLMARTPVDMKRLTNVLSDYCSVNSLEVNLDKSKIMIFRRGGRLGKHYEFFYRGRMIQLVSEYEYLGVRFSTSGLFSRATNAALSKAGHASHKIRSILGRIGINSNDNRKTLYNSMVRSVLMYGAEIWALRYEENIEKNQSDFLKLLYYLPRSTPGYVLRREFRLSKLIVIVLRRALGWCLKVLAMDDSRLPKICLRRQFELLDTCDVKFNWASQLRSLVLRAGYPELWDRLRDGGYLSVEECEALFGGLESVLFREDSLRIEGSTYCGVYRQLSLLDRDFQVPSVTLNRGRIIYQLLFLNKDYQSLWAGGVSHHFSPDAHCKLCNLNERDSVEHFVLNCPIVKYCRPPSFETIFERADKDYAVAMSSVMKFGNLADVERLLNFVLAALKMRHFVLDSAGD